MEARPYQGEYECGQCGHRFDRLGSDRLGSKEGELCCPRCGSQKVECSPFLFDTRHLISGDYWAVCAPPCYCGTRGWG